MQYVFWYIHSFSIFSVCTQATLERFHHLKEKRAPPTPSHLPSPQTKATSRLLSLHVDLYILHSAYTWNHAVCGLFFLVAFQEHRVLQDHGWPRRGRCQNFILWLDNSPLEGSPISWLHPMGPS